MGVKDMRSDFRKVKRHEAKYGALAFFFPPAPDDVLVIGKLLDISPHGLALQYFARSRPVSLPKRLDVFGVHHPLMHIERIPGEIVYDFEVKSPTRSALKERRCGVEFGKLSELQRVLLDEFISSYSAQ